VGVPILSTNDWRQPERYSRYKALKSELIHNKPSSYQEVAQHQVWQGAMVEYNSIM